MGFLTTLTIYNDGLDDILEHSEEFMEKLHAAIANGKTNTVYIGGMGHMKVQKTRHADDQTIYFHGGNALTEINPYSDSTLQFMEANPEAYSAMLRFMRKRLDYLDHQFEVYQESKKE